MVKERKNYKTLKILLIEFGFVILLAGLVTATSVLHYGLINKQRWTIAAGYANDSLGGLTLMKVAENGEFHPFQSLKISHLGAPYAANWDDFPVTDPLLWWLGGYLSRCIGLDIASNILLLLAHMISAIAMYFCLRWVSCNRLWSFIFSVCFALSFYLFHRGFSHIVLTFSQTVPIICAVCYILFKNGFSYFNKWQFGLLCFASFYIGMVFPYYTAVYLQVLLAALIFFFVNEGKPLQSWPYFLISSLVLTGFFLQVSPNLLYAFDHGKNYFAIDRAYANLQVAALRPIEMFLPGSESHVPGLKQLSIFYENQDIFRKDFKFSESMAAYLGIVGCMAFCVLVGRTIYQVFSKKQQSISGWFWFVLWFISLSVVGGLNGVAGLAKIYFFRSSNRMSVFILAGSLFFLAQLLTRKSKNWKPWVTSTVASLILILAIYEALPQPLFSPQCTSILVKKVDADKSFFQTIEKSLPKGAMLFNYPVIQFPENGTYAALYPYLLSQNLRFSFGSVKGRAREQWQQEVQVLPVDEMVGKLQDYGFNGILVYKGLELEPGELAKVSIFLSEMEKLGYSHTQSPSGEFQFFKITPVSNPTFPSVNPFFTLNWWGADVQFDYTPSSPTNGVRWASQRVACLEVFNEQKSDRTFKIKGRLVSIKDSTLQIEMEGKPVWSSQVLANQFVNFETQPLLLKPGETVLTIHSSALPTLVDGRKFSFGVADIKVGWNFN